MKRLIRKCDRININTELLKKSIIYFWISSALLIITLITLFINL